MPRLLKLLDEGCTVTIDAMGCQKKMARMMANQSEEALEEMVAC